MEIIFLTPSETIYSTPEMNVSVQHVHVPFLSMTSKLAKKFLQKVPGCKGLKPFLTT
jgi:hypothetical protein